jgi:hypothetical protein
LAGSSGLTAERPLLVHVAATSRGKGRPAGPMRVYSRLERAPWRAYEEILSTKGVYEMFPLGLKFSHLVLLRNLD